MSQRTTGSGRTPGRSREAFESRDLRAHRDGTLLKATIIARGGTATAERFRSLRPNRTFAKLPLNTRECALSNEHCSLSDAAMISSNPSQCGPQPWIAAPKRMCRFSIAQVLVQVVD